MRFSQIAVALAAITLASSWAVAQGTPPPRTDYCKMLERDIEGEHHGFLAGNKLYYVAGMSPAEWDRMTETETLGFTHPMFRDGRARGFGIVTEEQSGTGHDCWGWDFYRHNKGAYGTLIIDGERFKHPKAEQTLWRPDRQINTYSVGGVNIREQKFISKNDVLTDIITSDKDVEILFEGESFHCSWKVPGFDGDDPSQPMAQGNDSKVSFDRKDNAIRLVEDGRVFTKPLWKHPVRVGKTMYSGLSFVLTSDVELLEPKMQKDGKRGNMLFSFKLKIPAGVPVTLTYSVADRYRDALASAKAVLADPSAELEKKTSHMNDLLNEQIPYFRCSDDLAVKTYYYLWSLYFMYFRDIGEGYLKYPHTQTAINNFMGLHLWDSWAYTQAGSWVADKWAYGHGNVLSWQFMVPFKNKGNQMPDTFGKAWRSIGSPMGFTGTVEPAWEQYRRSGDRAYLNEVYAKLYRPLYRDNGGPTRTFGIEANAINTLQNMARELGMDEDVALWEGFRKKSVDSFKHQWSGKWDGFFGGRGTPWKDIWALVALQSDVMPKEWGQQMIDKYVMDTEVGFMSPVGINTRAADDPPNGIFRCSTISLWLGVDGMFRQGRPYPAQIATLNHIKGMTREWGYPVAPEAWTGEHKAWGSRYYNWDIALVCPMLEWLAGIDYSIPESRFTLKPHLPPTWDFIETRTPVVLVSEPSGSAAPSRGQRQPSGRDGPGLLGGPEARPKPQTHWVQARVERRKRAEDYVIMASIEGSPFEKNRVEISPEGRNVIETHEKKTSSGAAAVARLSKKKHSPYKTLAWVTPRTRIFHKEAEVHAENLTPGTVLRYTSDGRAPTEKSPIFPENGLRIEATTPFTFKSFGADGASYLPFELTFKDTDLLPASDVSPGDFEVGLDYVAYEIPGNAKRIPDFEGLKEIGRGHLGRDDLAKDIRIQTVQEQLGRKEDFALLITGYLEVPEDEVYNIHVASDDGSRLFINDQLVIDLNSSSDVDPWFREGFVGLKKGLHRINIEYYQAHHRTKLQYDIRPGNEAVREPVPAESWWRTKLGR